MGKVNKLHFQFRPCEKATMSILSCKYTFSQPIDYKIYRTYIIKYSRIRFLIYTFIRWVQFQATHVNTIKTKTKNCHVIKGQSKAEEKRMHNNYLTLVGYSSGVYWKIVLYEPVILNFPTRVKMVAQMTIAKLPSVKCKAETLEQS